MPIKTQKQVFGQIGEDIACKFLVKHGFSIILRNYWKPFGEIDVICQKEEKLHFIEVKTVSRATNALNNDEYRPEDNIHKAKLLRIGRTVQSYIYEYNVLGEWQFDVVNVYLDHTNKQARVKMISDLVL